MSFTEKLLLFIMSDMTKIKKKIKKKMPPNKDLLMLVFKKIYRYRTFQLVKQYRNKFEDCTQLNFGCRYKPTGWGLNYRNMLHQSSIFTFNQYMTEMIGPLPKRYIYSSGHIR